MLFFLLLFSQVFLQFVRNFNFCFSFIWWDTFCLLSRVVTPLLPYFFSWRLFTCVNFSTVCIISFPFLFLLFFITLMIPYLFLFGIFYFSFTQVVIASHIFVNQFVPKKAGASVMYFIPILPLFLPLSYQNISKFKSPTINYHPLHSPTLITLLSRKSSKGGNV